MYDNLTYREIISLISNKLNRYYAMMNLFLQSFVQIVSSDGEQFLERITGNFKDKVYIGISALNWKFRWYNYTQSSTNPLLKNQTALSK